MSTRTSKTVVATAAILTAAIGVLAALRLTGNDPEPATREPPLRYSVEYPGIDYTGSEPAGRLGRFMSVVGERRDALEFRAPRGYLDSILEALDIDASSQMLVFSRTSLQVGAIGPATPRAIYFNDDTFVAWVPGAPTVEIASFDPLVGPVFYTVAQEASGRPALDRKTGTCLRCHDSYSLTGGGVPRFLLGSGYIGTDGELVSHEAWILTHQGTPMRSRWGGWYVTGRHGDQVHLGNIVVERAEDLQDLESLRKGNLDTLEGLFDTSIYPTPLSDIVALLVLEHEIETYNLISRLRYEALGPGDAAERDQARIGETIDELLGAMLMTDAIRFTDPVSGSSGFAEHFRSLGPFDSAGRSLRELDLQTRLFRYPLSFLVYSEAFAALPAELRQEFFARLDAILSATPADDGLTGLSVADRSAIAGILSETLPPSTRR